jgi:hypothetical protein
MVGPRSKILIRLGLIIAIGLVALGMRLYFANRHVIDQDEPTYLNAALRYSTYLRSGQYTWLAWDQENYQHPVLSKILYGIVLLTQDPLVEMHVKNFDAGMPIQSAEGKAWGTAGRYTSAALGTLASLALAVFNPLAGFFFATQSLNVISTSVVGLEALPLLTSFLAGIFYLGWVKRISSEAPSKYASAWLFFSAVALGMTAASKYTYCVVGLAIIIHFFLTSLNQPRLRKYYPHMAAWAVLSLMAFFIFDPYLWPHPVERLRKSLLFHASYSQSSNVTEEPLPFWQPFIWLGTTYYQTYKMYRHQLIFAPDRLIALLALIGLPGLWKREKFYFIWLVSGLVLLLAWPTKWPQYALIVMVPLCVSAAQGVLALFSSGKELARRIIKKKAPATG